MKEYIIQAFAEETIKSFDEHNAPELVRCKNCWKREYDNCPFREWADVFPPDDFFCADGEEKINDNG